MCRCTFAMISTNVLQVSNNNCTGSQIMPSVTLQLLQWTRPGHNKIAFVIDWGLNKKGF